MTEVLKRPKNRTDRFGQTERPGLIGAKPCRRGANLAGVLAPSLGAKIYGTKTPLFIQHHSSSPSHSHFLSPPLRVFPLSTSGNLLNRHIGPWKVRIYLSIFESQVSSYPSFFISNQFGKIRSYS
jgi:hypothetical protein